VAVRSERFSALYAVAVVGATLPFLLGCWAVDMLSGMAPQQTDEAVKQAAKQKQAEADGRKKVLEEQQSASGASALTPDTTEISGSHRLTFEGANPAPNSFALMNATGFRDNADNTWIAQKTVKFVPTGGSAGFDRYMLDVKRASGGALSGTVSFTRKMVLTYPDTGKDSHTVTTVWKGTVTGVLNADGTIVGKVTGSSTGDSVYNAENWPLEGPAPPPDIKPATPFTWTFIGDY
jgi:hypothetical protein